MIQRINAIFHKKKAIENSYGCMMLERGVFVSLSIHIHEPSAKKWFGHGICTRKHNSWDDE